MAAAWNYGSSIDVNPDREDRPLRALPSGCAACTALAAAAAGAAAAIGSLSSVIMLHHDVRSIGVKCREVAAPAASPQQGFSITWNSSTAVQQYSSTAGSGLAWGINHCCLGGHRLTETVMLLSCYCQELVASAVTPHVEILHGMLLLLAIAMCSWIDVQLSSLSHLHLISPGIISCCFFFLTCTGDRPLPVTITVTVSSCMIKWLLSVGVSGVGMTLCVCAFLIRRAGHLRLQVWT
jgi:hypothetical protein